MDTRWMIVRQLNRNTKDEPHLVDRGSIKHGYRGVVAVGVLGLIATFTPAQAESPGHTNSPEAVGSGARDSRLLNVSPVVEGKVSKFGRESAAAGALVYLQAWPREDVMAEMEHGDPLDLTTIAWTVADDDGRYVLRIDPDLEIDHLWSERGTLDVDVVAMHTEDLVPYSFSVVPAANLDPEAADENPHVAEIDQSTRAITKSIHVDLELGNPSGAVLASHVDEAIDDGEIVAEATSSSGGSRLTLRGGTCPGGKGLKARYPDRWVNVGSIHISASGKDMRFTYSGSADSTLGVGVSVSGSYGTFSRSGTVTRGRSVSTTYPWYKSQIHRHLDTLYSYGKYCVELWGGGYVYHRYVVRAIRHEGGTRGRTAANPSTPSAYCIPYKEPGSGGSKTTTNAITWTNGAKLGTVIGIDLSSRTGFRTDAKIDYVFKTGGRLCGTHDRPNGSPRRLVMRGP